MGSPPFHIEVEGGNLKWQRNTTYGWDVPWQMPLVRDSWVSIMVHERFASDGFLEIRKKGMYPSQTIYQGLLRIGTTRSSVEG